MSSPIKQLCHWHPFATATELEHAAVAEILRAADHAIKNCGSFHLVLAGGTTPRRVYEALRHATTHWLGWHIYFGDERCLPSDDAERNSYMAASAWLNHVAIPATQIHPIETELGATLAAERYAQQLMQVERFDLVLLGLGEDGHTASLFPQHDWGVAADAPATLVISDAPKPPAQRVSLSARCLSEAHQVIFLVTGNGKIEAVKNWRSGVSIPAAAITPKQGVEVYLEAVLLNQPIANS